MRAVITGISGFVGVHLTRHLLAEGDLLRGLDRTRQRLAGPAGDAARVTIDVLDIARAPVAELAGWLADARPEAIYHLAAQSNPQASLADPRATWDANLGGTLNLLEALRHAGLSPRVLLISSGVAYGNPPPQFLAGVTEYCPLRPNNPYSASKAAADLAGTQAWLTWKLPVLVARPFNHAGPGQADSYVLSSFARQIVEIERGQRARLEVGNLEVVRDFTDVRDIVRAYRLLVARGEPGEIYNIGTGRRLSLAQLLDGLRGLARAPIEVRVDPARLRPVDQPLLLADAGKLHAATGWTPEIPIEQTLDDMLNDWRVRLEASA
jgi:GDP-4-dehydro-6-deoxy-D-mannose reductase